MLIAIIAILSFLIFFNQYIFTPSDKSSVKQLTYNTTKKKNFSEIQIIEASINEAIVDASGLSAERCMRIPSNAKIGFYYPSSYKKGMNLPVLFAMSPGAGNAMGAIYSFRQFAEEIIFIVAASEVAADKDIEEARFYYILHAIDYLKKKSILTNETSIWIGGISGGAKWALHLGAWGGKIFSGILAISSNEDFATLGYRQLHNTTALNVPICMINGLHDNIAGVDDYNYYAMIWTMKQTGFRRIKVVVYDGGHNMPFQETIDAFKWLLNNEKP